MLLAGCGSSGAVDDGSTVTLVYPNVGAFGESITGWLGEAAEDFEGANEGVSIELEPVSAIGQDFYTKLNLMQGSEKTAPDVIFEDSFQIVPDASAGYIQPIKGIESWQDWSRFSEPMREIVSHDGEIYGVMNNTDVQVLYYNRELLRDAGIEVPWQPRSWEDVLDAARRVGKAHPDIVPLYLYMGVPSEEATTMRTFETLLGGTATWMYDYGEKRWVTCGPGISATWDFLEGVFEEGLGPPTKYWSTPSAAELMNGQLMPGAGVAIAIDGVWVAGAWGSGGDWPEGFDVMDAARVPDRNGGGYTSMSGGWALSLGAKASNPKLATRFIKFASGKERLARFNAGMSLIPPRSDSLKTPVWKESTRDNPVLREAATYLDFTRFRPALGSEYNRISVEIQELTGDIALGRMSSRQAAEAYDERVTDIVGEQNAVCGGD